MEKIIAFNFDNVPNMVIYVYSADFSEEDILSKENVNFTNGTRNKHHCLARGLITASILFNSG